MIKRKIATTLIATPLSLLVIFAVFFGEWRQPLELIVMTGTFSLWISPFILLYGVPVTFLSDYVSMPLSEKNRILFAFIIHLLFGILFGFIFPMNAQLPFSGVMFEVAFVFATIVALFFWSTDEILRKIVLRFR